MKDERCQACREKVTKLHTVGVYRLCDKCFSPNHRELALEIAGNKHQKKLKGILSELQKKEKKETSSFALPEVG